MWGRTVRVPRLHDKPSNFVDEHIDIACRYRIHSARVTCSSPSFMMSVSKNDPIAIIGAGAFGLSTALELSNQGYTNITVFEKDEEIPSRWSAAISTRLCAQNMRMISTRIWLWYVAKQFRESNISGLTIRIGSDKRMANASLRAILPPCRLPELCIWKSTTEGCRHHETIPGSGGKTPCD
jgi:hypothetical protein